MIQMRALLSDRALRRLLLAQVPADFADWLDFVAIGALLAFHWHVEPVVFAWLAVALGLPYLIVGPAAGALVDRLNLRRVLIASNLGRALATLALAFATGWPSLLALILLRGIADSFFTPAKQAALQTLAPPDLRMGTNGLSHAINQASKIVAPSMGGVLLLALPPSGVFVVNALVSITAVFLLWGLPDLRPAPTGERLRASLGAQIREGLRALNGKPLLRGTLALMATGYFAVFFYDTLIAPLIRDIGLTESALGLCLAAVGAGGIIGALALGLGAGPRRPLIWIALSSAVAAFLLGCLGLVEILNRPISLGLTCAIFAVIGLASSGSVVPTRAILQNEIAPAHIGRVTAISEAANACAMLTAPFLGAALASASTVGSAFVVGGLLLALSGGFALHLHHRHRWPA